MMGSTGSPDVPRQCNLMPLPVFSSGYLRESALRMRDGDSAVMGARAGVIRDQDVHYNSARRNAAARSCPSWLLETLGL